MDGILVIGLEQAVAAPYCTWRLAQAGARVIKIERPEGDFARDYDNTVAGQSSYFIWLNAGKQSIRLDLRRSENVDLVRRMTGRADVFIQNLAPGAAERLGLDATDLRKSNPRLITCSISGYGSGAKWKAYDLLVQAESGLCAVTGAKDSPARVGISICDIAAGIQAYAAVLRALLERVRTGRGDHVEISMYACATEWMAVPLLQTLYGGSEPRRMGVAHPTIAPYGRFRASDARDVLIAVQNDREWRRFAQTFLEDGAADDSRFATNILRVSHRPEVDARVAAAVGKRTSSAVLDALDDLGIAAARLRTTKEVLQHPALPWGAVMTPAGSIEVPWATDGTSRSAARVPGLGEHDDLIRREFAP